MADQAITPVVMTQNTLTAAIQAGASLTTSNDGVVTLPKDGKALLLFQITNKGTSGKLNIKGGSKGSLDAYKASQGDLSLDLSSYTNNDWVSLVIESARHKSLSGTDKGKVRINLGGTSTTVTAVCLALP